MCGRMTITLTIEQAAAALPGFRLTAWPAPRYNVAPTQTVPVVRNDQPADVHWLRWDLRPIGQGAPLINARAETLAEKSTFRNAYLRQRCLVLATGFYEWPQLGGRRESGPYYFQLRDEPLLWLAGLWDRVPGPDGSDHLACAIVTTTANDLLRPLHDRMPVMVPPAHRNRWLDPREIAPEALDDVLVPYPAVAMTARRVSDRVNSVRNDDAACLADPQPDPQVALPGFE